MKRGLIIVAIAIAILAASGYLVNENLEVGTFSKEEKQMIEWLTDKCLSKGITNVKNPDGDICVEMICGVEANYATGYLQTRKALKECYNRKRSLE